MFLPEERELEGSKEFASNLFGELGP
ncbi:protein of unknown function [Candidatus Nitrospira inopinata]|uniref:Uncharacterized protein n=1 Tax=Candidatus Nitrospira inopinata TaxID=1715989 RepID=A0A0S4KT46_9BACT|nr:protein of unknown function [Candidatus Nitrospira inopinata]